MTGPNLKAGMMTHSGQMVSMYTGVPTIEDIALALSRIPRFGGHCRQRWSVLDHSLLCERMARLGGATKPQRLAVLLHDAHEAVTGDIPSPLKVPQMKVLQGKLDQRIFAAHAPEDFFASEILLPEFVHAIDYRALTAEAVTVGPPGIGSDNVKELFGALPAIEDVVLVQKAARPAQHEYYDLGKRHIFTSMAKSLAGPC